MAYLGRLFVFLLIHQRLTKSRACADRIYDPLTYPEEWAFIHFNLAVIFMKRARTTEGSDWKAIDNSLYHLENSLQVCSRLEGHAA